MKLLTYEQLMRQELRLPPDAGAQLYHQGRQFPVCARCTGVMIGNAVAYALFFLYAMPQEFYILGCAIILQAFSVDTIQPGDDKRCLSAEVLMTGGAEYGY